MPHLKPSPLKVATLAVGDEVLLGETLNTNASWLATQMQQEGWLLRAHYVVGDEPEAIVNAVQQAMAQKVDLLVLTGGLGPTPDDLTVASLANAWGCPLKPEPKVLKQLEQRFAARGLSLPASNFKQADVPQGATVLMNPVGTAPALLWPRFEAASGCKNLHKTLLLLLPGVPKEMKTLWPLALKEIRQNKLLLAALPTSSSSKTTQRLQANAWFYGLGESHLLEALAPWLAQTQLLVAPYVNAEGAVRLRLQASLEMDETLAIACLKEAELAFKACPAFLKLERATASTPHLQLETLVGDALKQKQMTLSLAESCTGGLLSSLLTDVAGSSAYVQQNFVLYSNEAKHRYLGVPHDMLEKETAVSAAVAQAMVKGLLQKTSADLALATTGFAENVASETTPTPSLLYIALADRKRNTGLWMRFQGADFWDRRTLKARFCSEALYLLWSHLQQEDQHPCVLAPPRQVVSFTL